MRENYVKILLALGLLLPSSGSLAADKEIILDKDKSVDMAISIYNNSLGFVRYPGGYARKGQQFGRLRRRSRPD